MAALTLHDLAVSPRSVGVECEYCIRRAVVTAADLKAVRGDHRTLAQAGLRCGKCGSRQFTATLFQSRAKAYAFLRNL